MALSGVVSEIQHNIGADSQLSPTPSLFDVPWRSTQSQFPNDLYCGKKMMGLPQMVKNL